MTTKRISGITYAMTKGIPGVTYTGLNSQIFSSPKTREPLPVVTAPVTVSFKHEDSIDGMPLGPVGVTSPTNHHDLGWATRHVALTIAAHYGVTLSECK